MRKLIFLIESDHSLRENLSELLQLEGYEVNQITSEESKTVLDKPSHTIVIFNELTLSEPAEEFIRFLKGRVDGIIVLCCDVESPRLLQADVTIALPFDLQKILAEVKKLSNEIVV